MFDLGAWGHMAIGEQDPQTCFLHIACGLSFPQVQDEGLLRDFFTAAKKMLW